MKSDPLFTANVVMLGSFGAWTRGTIQSRALPLAIALTANTGLRVAIVTTPWDEPSQAGVRETVDGVRIFNTHACTMREAVQVVSEQAHLVRALRPSLVHVLKPKASAGMTALALRHLPDAPTLVVDCDDWEGDGGWNQRNAYPAPLRRLFNIQETRLIRLSSAVTAASTLLEERARRLRNDRCGSSVEYLPNGLASGWRERLSPEGTSIQSKARRGLVLYSRFAEFSPDWLWELLRAIDRKASSPLRLDIIGAIVEPKHLPLDLKWLQVHSHGYVERSALPQLLGRAAIALYPYDDNLINRSKQSVKFLELMASGCAIVSSDVGEIKRIGGDAVVIVKPEGTSSFAHAVMDLVNDPAKTANLSGAARKRAQLFEFHHVSNRLARVYRRLGVQ